MCAEIQVHDKTEKLHRRFSLTERDEKPTVSAIVKRTDVNLKRQVGRRVRIGC